MVVHPFRLSGSASGAVAWRRLPLALMVAAGIGTIDTTWKAVSLAAGRSAAALDVPSTILRPSLTLVIGIAALVSTLLFPPIFLPGTLLVTAGAGSNLFSLGLWRAVPNPLAVHLAGGVLHFNLADLCVTGGCALFLAAAWRTIWRMPAERFA